MSEPTQPAFTDAELMRRAEQNYRMSNVSPQIATPTATEAMIAAQRTDWLIMLERIERLSYMAGQCASIGKSMEPPPPPKMVEVMPNGLRRVLRKISNVMENKTSLPGGDVAIYADGSPKDNITWSDLRELADYADWESER